MVAEELINVAELIRRIKEGPCSSLDCKVINVKVSVGGEGNEKASSSVIEVDLVRDKAYLTLELKANELTCLIKLEVIGSVSVSELRRLSGSITELLNSIKP